MLPRHTRGASSKRSSGKTSWFRCAMLIAASAVFICLQIVFFTSLLPGISPEAATVSKELVDSLLRKFVEPTAAGAAEPDDLSSDSLFPPPFMLMYPPSAPPLASSGLERWDAPEVVARWRAAQKKRSAAHFAYDFKSELYSSHDVTLLGCLGNGTYGVVLNASLRHSDGTEQNVVVKLPLLRNWGFRFYRDEQRALDAMENLNAGGGGAPRNIVRALGNTTFSIEALLSLSSGGRRPSDGRGDRRRLLSLGGHAPMAEDDEEVYDYNDDRPFGQRGRASMSAREQGGLPTAHAQAPRGLEAEASAGGGSEVSRATEASRWRCLNRSDLLVAHSTLFLQRVPALLLEPLETVSVFKWLATVAATPAASSASSAQTRRQQLPPLDTQRRLFRAQLERHAKAPGAPLRDAFRSALTVLIGVARGLAALGRARILHRDLTEPGKNALFKRDATGLTASLIDLSQSEICPPGHGAAGRALEMYAYGNLLYYACYGEVAHSLPWTQYSCQRTPSKHLVALAANHRRLHGDEALEGKPAPPERFNRCHEKLRQPLDRLMHYCWAPALAAAKVAERSEASPHAEGGVNAGAPGEAAARLNHTWRAVISALEDARRQHVPLFRFL